MGLLDDAIREHLELKRRRGADPGEIAHQERDALEPIFREDEGEAIEGELDPIAPPPQAEAPLAEEELLVETGAEAEPPAAGEPEQAPSGLAHPGQETAELDMEEVLAADPGERSVPAPSDDPSARSDDSLEWEIPRRADQEPSPEDAPGQERLSFE